MTEWIINNKEWVFSGIGIFVLGLIITFASWLISRNKRKDKGRISMKQKGGINSKNYQAQGDININLINTDDDK